MPVSVRGRVRGWGRKWCAGLAAAAIVLGSCPPAQAWGIRGHRIAAMVAQQHLTPNAAKAVRELLNEGDSLATISSWADEFGRDVEPRSAPWHYVNVPVTAAGYSDRYCSDRGCVVSKIRDYRKVLADKKAPREQRQVALLFLVHFIQDVHQPLHVGDNNDRGGNDTQIQFNDRATNLHRIWDTDLIGRSRRNDREWAQEVDDLLTPQAIAAWSKGDVEDWANESHRASKLAYYYPKNAKRPIATGSRLGDDYLEFALPIVRERLAQAGIRVANELNALFP